MGGLQLIYSSRNRGFVRTDDAFIDYLLRGMLRARWFPPSDREKHVTRDIVARSVQRVHCRERIQSTALIQRMQARLNESSGCNLSGRLNLITLSSINICSYLFFSLSENQHVESSSISFKSDIIKMLVAAVKISLNTQLCLVLRASPR